MGLSRPIRVVFLVALTLWCFFIYALTKPSNVVTRTDKRPVNFERDPNLELTGEPEGILRRTGPGYDASVPRSESDRIPATLLALVRNSELAGMVSSMRQLERTWNYKFNYPWTFFNDVPFTDEFKRRTQAETKAECRYELIPSEHWDMPSWIDEARYVKSSQKLKNSGVQYAALKSYHQMCRWNSGLFYEHPALADVRYYWRVEPNVRFFCSVDYDVFRYMHDNNKTYGFTISLYDDPRTVATLWPETERFLDERGGRAYLAANNAIGWLTDAERRPDHVRKANGYSTCHFWSNFEIADMDLWRSRAYREYFGHLDKAGGFFYERWGDAPVHSIAVALFEDKSRVHWFRDIGYQHVPFFNCPNSPKCEGCVAGRFTDGEAWLHREDCRPGWFKEAGMG